MPLRHLLKNLFKIKIGFACTLFSFEGSIKDFSRLHLENCTMDKKSSVDDRSSEKCYDLSRVTLQFRR